MLQKTLQNACPKFSHPNAAEFGRASVRVKAGFSKSAPKGYAGQTVAAQRDGHGALSVWAQCQTRRAEIRRFFCKPPESVKKARVLRQTTES